MNVIICLDPFQRGPGLHWYKLDIITVMNITYHDVRVALAGSHRKFPGQVFVKLSLVDQGGIIKIDFVPKFVLGVGTSSTAVLIGVFEVALMFWRL
jgi:hypothetical protein